MRLSGEALVLMSRMLLFRFMCCFAPSDSHGTASNYIFAAAICELMVFLIDLYEAYHSVVAALSRGDGGGGGKDVAVAHLIPLFYDLNVAVSALLPKVFPRVSQAGMHAWAARFKRELNVLKRFTLVLQWCAHENTKGQTHTHTPTQCVIVHLVKWLEGFSAAVGSELWSQRSNGFNLTQQKKLLRRAISFSAQLHFSGFTLKMHRLNNERKNKSFPPRFVNVTMHHSTAQKPCSE